MFSKKKPDRPKRDHTGKNLAQYGLFDVPSNLSFDGGVGGNAEDDNDSDLEAELLALANEGNSEPSRPARRKPAVPTVNLDAMVAESMKDIPSDEELSGDDDPDLLNELSEIAGDEHEPEPQPELEPAAVSQTSTASIANLLQERLKMYEIAETNAKSVGETNRARRFGRGIKTIKDLIKQAKAGKPINDDDIPPEVSATARALAPIVQDDSGGIAQPTRPAPKIPGQTDTPNEEIALTPVSPGSPSSPVLPVSPDVPSSPPAAASTTSVPESSENAELLQLLNTRRDQYKMAALTAKRSGDQSGAVSNIKIAKQFEAVIKAVQEGQPVDLSRMPGPPGEPAQPTIEQSEVQTEGTDDGQNQAETEEAPEENLITASSLAEALQQRLELYKSQEQAAKDQGNSSKARRMGRIVKQFQDAIKLNNAGKSVPLDDLPTPPGYAPLPGTEPVKPPEPQTVAPAKPKPPPKPAAPQLVQSPPAPAPSPPDKTSMSRISGNHQPTTRAEKQIAMLQARQKEFKEAALNAKKKGEIAQAKEFLRSAKGFDPLIEAAMGGLPVDIASLPIPPSARSQLEDEYDVVMGEECTEDDTGTLDVLARLENQLTKQLKMSLSTRDHNKAIGDVAGMNRFEQLALSVTRDLDVIRLARRSPGSDLPKFHYETKDFSIVKSCTDLNDSDLELTIIRGINYNCTNPKDIDTYVKFEFPYPQEEPVRNRTVIVKDTNNPEYNGTFVLPIQRTARQCLRVFKRHGIKLEVYSRGGLFRGDTLLGVVSVKLQPLETQCELHDSFDLIEGRKKVGGKLEVRIRVRDPLVTRQVEQLSEKWLVLDH